MPKFKLISLTIFLVLFSVTGKAQKLTQTVKGTITDSESKSPLAYATVILLNTNPVVGTTTDKSGKFEIKDVPVGRHSFKISYIGYNELLISDIMVVSGKEAVLNIQLQEKFYTKGEVTVYGNKEKDRTLNSIALISARTFSVEESNRYAGGFNDLSRMVTAFAGVSSLNGETNEIVIRGNSPRGLLWRFEGVEISNPNHFPRGDGSGGGGISIVTSDIISNSDFFTGAFPAEYGNALSGVFDINLRQGNADTHELALKFGAIGIEAAAEGPLSKNSQSSYLINYRYSTLTLLNNLGFKAVSSSVVPTFQDLTFNTKIQTKKLGTFNLFGIAGISTAGEKAKEDSGQWIKQADKIEEFEAHRTGVVGLKNMYIFGGQKTYLHTVALLNIQQNSIFQDSLGHNYVAGRIYDENIQYQTLRLSTMLNHKLNVRNTLRFGVIHSFTGFSLYGNKLTETGKLTEFINNNGNTGLTQGYANWKHRITENLTATAGLHSLYFHLTNQITVEPRVAMRWNFAAKHAISYGFGLHSQTEPVSLYFTEIYDADNTYTMPNQELTLAKSVHNVFGYDFLINHYNRLKIELFHQQLYSIPISTDPTSTYSTINDSGGLNGHQLNNEGTGYNYGIEFTLERFLHHNFYYLATASLFDSKYTAPNGIEYNTLYNSNFLFNCLGGKEFELGGNNTFGINSKIFYKKGNRTTPINLELSEIAQRTIYNFDKTYHNRTPDFVRWDAGVSFRQNRELFSWVFSLDIQNVLNRKNVYSEYYNSETNSISYRYALPLIPVFNLKIELK